MWTNWTLTSRWNSLDRCAGGLSHLDWTTGSCENKIKTSVISDAGEKCVCVCVRQNDSDICSSAVWVISSSSRCFARKWISAISQAGNKKQTSSSSFLNVTLETDRSWAHTPTELWFLEMNKQIKDDESSLCVRRASAWWSRSSWTTWWSRWTEQKTNVSPKRVVTTQKQTSSFQQLRLSWSPNVFTTSVTTRGIKKTDGANRSLLLDR